MTGPDIANFLQRYRKPLIAAFIIVLLAISGFFAYEKYQRHQVERAAVLYSELLDAMAAQQWSPARASAETLVSQYGHTPYGLFAHFFLARLDSNSGQTAKATAQLQAVIHADDAPVGMTAMARLSLARVYLQESQPQQALSILKVESPPFAALYAEARGDAYAALHQPDPAMQAYAQALAKLPATDPYRAYLQMKMANIGVAP